MTKLIIVSTEWELSPLLKMSSIEPLSQDLYSFEGRDDVKILIAGVGTPATLMNLHKHSLQSKPDEILQVGFCGSFDPNIPLGEICEVNIDRFADLGFDDNGTFLPLVKELPGAKGEYGWINYQAKTGLPIQKGITVNTTSGSAARIEQMRTSWEPDVETMEGAAGMLFCKEMNIPYCQVRAISNYVTIRRKEEWNMELAAENLADWLLTYMK